MSTSSDDGATNNSLVQMRSESLPLPRPDPAGVLADILQEEEALNVPRAIDPDEITPLDFTHPERRSRLQPLPNISKVVLAACIGSFLFGFSVSQLNTCLGHIVWEMRWCQQPPAEALALSDSPRECHMAINYEAFITTALFIGATLGSLTCGGLLSAGRRVTILISFAIFFFAAITTVLSSTWGSFVWARLVNGYAVGLASVAVPTYLSEMTPPKVRGFYGIFHQIFIVTGILIGTAVSLPLAFLDPIPQPMPSAFWRAADGAAGDEGGEINFPTPSLFGRLWWRGCVLLALIPILIGAYLIGYVFPFETPHWYLRRQRDLQALRVLQHVNDKEDVTVELTLIQTEVQTSQVAQRAGMSLWKALRIRELRSVILLGCVLSAFQQLSGINVFVSASTDMFREANLSERWAAVSTTIIFFINVVATFPAAFLIERTGRRKLLMTGCIMQTLSLIPAVIAYWVYPDTKFAIWAGPASVLGFILSFAIGYGPILWVYLFEVYPLEIKSGSSSLAVACNWLAAILIVFASRYLRLRTNFVLFAGLSLLSVIVMTFFVRETKGRSLGDSPYVTRSNR